MIDPMVRATGTDVRSFMVEASVAAPPSEVWVAWTSSDQMDAWWGPAASNIDLRIGGPFEILFNLDEAEGKQGSETCVYLGYVPNEMISFTWNAPPHLPLREAHTWVVITFEPTEEGTAVSLTHTGFLEGSDWDDYIEYFKGAWAHVLGLLSAHWS